MDIEYKGANCIVITTKNETVVVDPKLSDVGLKDVKLKSGVVVATQPEFLVRPDEGLVVEGPGEYETLNTAVKGVSAMRMIDHDKIERATMYRISVGDVNIAVVGHVAAPLTEAQMEELGVIDIAIIPVGGSGYTLDAHQAVSVVRELGPKVVIPTHYQDSAIKYEVPQMDLEAFVKELGVERETTPKYKVKNGVLPEVLTVVEVTRTA